MTPEALEALKASIAHWERKVADPEKEKIGPKSCALCVQFIEDDCVGCPVRDKTGYRYCDNTPYWKVSNAQRLYRWSEITLDEFRAACQLELDFLKSLLPKDESK